MSMSQPSSRSAARSASVAFEPGRRTRSASGSARPGSTRSSATPGSARSGSRSSKLAMRGSRGTAMRSGDRCLRARHSPTSPCRCAGPSLSAPGGGEGRGEVARAAELRMADDTILEIEGLEAGYGEVQVLWGISLKVPRGHLTTVVGANGAGKTTTLKALVGTLPPWRGRVAFAGQDVTRLPAHAKAARGLVLVPEGRQLFAQMSVEENLEMGAFAARGARRYKERLAEVFALFPRLAER